MSYWREKARRHILFTAAAYRTAGGPPQRLEAHLRAHYPFGQRAYYPYQVWLKELRRFLAVERGEDPLTSWNRGEPIRAKDVETLFPIYDE